MKRPAHSRRSMQTLIWIAVSFCAAQFGGGLCLDYVWPEIRFPSAYRKLATLRAWPCAPAVLCLGSSRLGTDCLQDSISRQLQERYPGALLLAYNASLTAGDFTTNEFFLKKLLRSGIQPTVAVIEITPEMLARRNTWLQMDLSRQLRWDDLPHYLADIYRADQLGRLCMDRFAPLYVHRADILEHLARRLRGEQEQVDPDSVPRLPPASVRRSGTSARLACAPRQTEIDWPTVLARSAAGCSSSQLERTEIGLYGPRRVLRPGYQIGGTATECFERMLARCRARGITVVLLGVPVCTQHRELYTPEIEGAFQAYLTNVSRSYGCRFVDYRDQIPDGLFFDNHHVGPDGGEYFSRRFTHEVLEPLFAPTRDALENAGPITGAPPQRREDHS